MKKNINNIIFLWLLFVICSCYKEEDAHLNTDLALNILVSSNTISLDEELTIAIEVKNADSLFALSFEFHYDADLFNAELSTTNVGDLFFETFDQEFLLEGEISVALGELGDLQVSSSGTAFEIALIPKGIGSDLIYISSLHMIKSNGNFIDGFNMLSVEPVEVTIRE